LSPLNEPRRALLPGPMKAPTLTSTRENGGMLPGVHDKEPLARTIYRFLYGNLTPWWLFSAILVVYFLITLGLPRVTESPTMAAHIPMALIFSICCLWNLYHTPSHGHNYMLAHKTMGWLGMIAGVISVITGYWFMIGGESAAALGTQVLMMSIGAMQLAFQVLGLWYIRGVRWIEMHMTMMTFLFYMSGVLIAVNWLPKMITGSPMQGTGATNWMFVSFLIGLACSAIAVKYNKKRMNLWDQ